MVPLGAALSCAEGEALPVRWWWDDRVDTEPEMSPVSDETEPLRARITELESQLHQAELSAGDRPRKGRSHTGAWAVTSSILITLACLLAPLSVVSVWADAQVSDTDQYVRTVAPLAQDPVVQEAIAAEVTSVILESLDIDEVTQGLVGALSARENMPPRIAAALPALAGPINDGVENFVGTEVDAFVASDQFAKVWTEVNRVAHDQVVRLLEGDRRGIVTTQDDEVTLNLAPIVAQVKQELVNRGFTMADVIPEVDRSFVLIHSSAVVQTQGAYRLLSAAGGWLPLVALVLFGLGVLAAGDRRRALLRGALGVVTAMLLAGVALAIFRATYVGSTTVGADHPAAALAVFDTLVHSLRTGIRAVAVLGIVVAVIAYLSGPSSSARGTRSIFGNAIAKLRGGAESAGWRTGGAGVWFHTHKHVLRAVILIAGGLVVVFWTSPTAWVVVGVAAVVALAMAVLEFLAQPPVPRPVVVAAASETPTPTK